jgi:GxxExxY protein
LNEEGREERKRRNQSHYQRALELELAATGLEYAREVDIRVYYKGRKIGTRRVDFVIEGCILEIKAKSVFDPQDYVQAESYVKAAGYPLGLLINFGASKIQIKRIMNNPVQTIDRPH